MRIVFSTVTTEIDPSSSKLWIRKSKLSMYMLDYLYWFEEIQSMQLLFNWILLKKLRDILFLYLWIVFSLLFQIHSRVAWFSWTFRTRYYFSCTRRSYIWFTCNTSSSSTSHRTRILECQFYNNIPQSKFYHFKNAFLLFTSLWSKVFTQVIISCSLLDSFR